MWRRVYLILALVRLYFALSPSYLHPDEHFQGPEVIAAKIFGFPAHATWEFTSETPIRSLFPLWLVYGWPLTVLKWISKDIIWVTVPPAVIFYTLRLLMFLLSFVLQDWALYELLPVPGRRREAILLFSSSYVTWTWQSHTFSNAIESIILLSCLVIVKRLRNDEIDRHLLACMALAFLGVLGIFNRITFPAFMIPSAYHLLPFFCKRPLALLVTCLTAGITLALAIAVDTEYYTSGTVTLSTLRQLAVFTPLNNLRYNLDPSNLAQHGLHPRYQHILINLPQLLGPLFPLLFIRPRFELEFWSTLSGLIILSLFEHQEARFLLPTIPLFLASIRLPQRGHRLLLGAWLCFNVALGVLMGIFHQGGIVPAQLWIARQENISKAIWWKTLSPPNYLLGSRAAHVTTVDLMGMHGSKMVESINLHLSEHRSGITTNKTVLVAPSSATYLDTIKGIQLKRLFYYSKHLNLDDIDLVEDGILPTLNRLIGRRGLAVYEISRAVDL